MQAQQAATQAQIQMQQASATAAASQQAAANAANSTSINPGTAAPAFSIHSGSVPAGTTIRLKSRTHLATIYYTTNGWAPTIKSKRYTGPITISHTVVLQAIAVAPTTGQSLIASATYSVAGTLAHNEPAPLTTDGTLHAGTSLHLVTAATVSSKTAQVGDPIQLVLNQDVRVGATTVIPKGTPVEARIVQADHSGHLGVPGDIAFEVHSLTIDGKQIALTGGETLEGRNHYSRNHLVLIPVVGAAALAFRGDEAQINPGMPLTAAVAQDTPLEP
ncbi:MAG TPA: chitobiase/beta-hexosaminidase C-terminal domain-containing protein [Candidatus Koribacter sp.]|jgi:hypothetical protein